MKRQSYVSILACFVLLTLIALPLVTRAGPASRPQRSGEGEMTTVPLRGAWAGPAFAPGRVLVRFNDGVKAQAGRALLAQHGLTVVGQIERIDVQILAVPGGQELALAEQLRADPRLAYAEPDYVYQALTTPDDAYYDDYQWNMPQIDAESGWNITTGSSSVTIAIVDTGVDVGHPDLAAKIVTGYDFVNNDSDPSDDEGHGTHVAGVAAAVSDNGEGVAGVSWGARIMPIKVLGAGGSGYISDIADGIIWATDHGAQIINLSLGGTSSSSTLEDAVDYAYGQGALLVAAAGNEYEEGNPTGYPAAYDHVLAVAATGDEDEHADYSNAGFYVDVAAPGGNPSGNYDTDPNHWITSTYWRGSGYSYAQVAGTSQASPHVAGLGALILSVNSGLSNDQVETFIESTAVDLGDAGRDDVFGHGRIDAAAAVAAAQAGVATSTPTPLFTATPTRTPTPTGTPTSGPSPTPTVTSTASPLPTATPTSAPADTPTPGPSPTPTASPTPRRPVGNVRVNDDTGLDDQSNPDIAVDLLGHALAVWTDRRNGGAEDVFSSRLPANVYLWGPNQRVDDGRPGSRQLESAVATDNRGRAVAVWKDDRDTNPDIYSALLEPGSGGWSANAPVNDVTTGMQIHPDVVIDRQGTVYVVWEDRRDGPNDPDIYWASLPAGAPGWSPSRRVNEDHPGGWQTRPALAVDRYNNLYVVWQDTRSGGLDIYFAMLPAGATVWTTGVRVNDVATDNQVAPDIAVDHQGTVHVVWEDHRHGPNDADIYWAKSPAGPPSWSAGRRINDDTGTAPQREPDIAVTRRGSVYVVWADGRNDYGTLPPNNDIYFALLRQDALHWSRNRRVNSDQGQANQDQPAIAADWDGNGYVVWRDLRNTATGPDIYFALLSSPELLRLYLPLLVKEG